MRRMSCDARTPRSTTSSTQLADAAGAAVGEVVRINESSGHQAPSVMAMEPRGMMMRGTPVESGHQELRVDVDVTYRLVAPG